ncbi:unnamed protein product, partial [Ectocarpus sp. 12 AP-2014]
MLGLFCSSARLEDSYSIPPTEVIFYIFMLGTLWREILEFSDGVPARHRRYGRRKRNNKGNQANIA